MFGTFFLISLAMMLLYKFLTSIHKVNAVDFKNPNWRRVGGYAAVVGVIVLCEAVAPSFRLTGLKPPELSSPLRHLDNLTLADSELSYAEFAARAPWAWSLGYVTRSEMERRIDEDLGIAAAMLKESKELAAGLGQSSIYARAFGGRVPRLTAYIDGLKAARKDLDTLFVTPQRLDAPQQTAVKAEVFIYDHVRNVVEANRTAAEVVRDAADLAVADYVLSKGEALDRLAPEYVELVKGQSEASGRWSQTFSPLLDLDLIKSAIERRERDHSVDATIPKLNRAAQMYHQRFLVRAPENPETGPELEVSFRRAALAGLDAVLGRTRSGPENIEEYRCVVAVVDVAGVPTPRKLCESVIALPVDYDLTASACGSGNTTDGCSESWIFPHLNIVYEKDRFTVYTPHPAGGSPTISVWHATWNGVEQPLTPSATFDWDGTSDVLASLVLRHDVDRQAVDVQIWDDVRNVSIAADNKALNKFKPVTLSALHRPAQSEIVPTFMALGEEDTDILARSGWQLPRLRTSLQQHQDLLILMARDIQKMDNPTGAIPSALSHMSPCGYYRYTSNAVVDSEITNSMRDIVAVDTGQACDAVLGYAKLLEALERASFGGSWLWLFKWDR